MYLLAKDKPVCDQHKDIEVPGAGGTGDEIRVDGRAREELGHDDRRGVVLATRCEVVLFMTVHVICNLLNYADRTTIAGTCAKNVS